MNGVGDVILRAAAEHGERIAFRARRGFQLQSLSFRAAADLALRVGAWLHEQGLRPGDRIAIWSPNLPEYAVLLFGAWLAGVVVVPIDLRTTQEVADRFVAAAAPRLGFRSRAGGGAFGPPVAGVVELEDLFDLVRDRPGLGPSGLPRPRLRPDALAEIAYTSGTTGVPKGTVLTHANLLAELRALQVTFPLDSRDRALSLLPLSHVYEQVTDLLLAVSAGIRMTYLPRPGSVTILRALQEEGITCFTLVPEMLRVLLAGVEREVRARGGEGRWRAAMALAPRLPRPVRRLLFRPVHRALGGHVRFIACGSAPLDEKLATAWEAMGIPIYEGYGLTEVSGVATLNNWRAKRLGTVGRPLPGVEIRVAGDGEILIRGPTVTSGYFNAPELTAAAFRDGWFRTGDVGRFDADGYLRILGRQAFRIVLADGRNVYPEDVERALNGHPLVRESCVVGVERARGEVVHAVLLTDHPERRHEIVREINRALEAQQQITEVSVWPEPDFPRTPMLKVDRARVRAALGEGRPVASTGDPLQDLGADPLASPVPARSADSLLAILAELSERPAATIREEAQLEKDLGLDSIGRIEVLTRIEEDLGVVVDELELGPQTSVARLRDLVAAGEPTTAPAPRVRWPRVAWARLLGRGLLWITFRLQDRWMEMEVVHPERIAEIPFPSILIFNYQGPYVPIATLRALPPHLRSRVAVAADARIFQGRDRWQGWLAALIAQAFPFVKSGGAVRAGLEELARWLDDGYAVIVSPEGNPEEGGQLLPFLPGTGLVAVEMQVPVVPIRVDGYHLLFPGRDLPFPYFPNRRGRFRLIIGRPVRLPRGLSPHQATERLRQALIETD
jgi:long-chain acyl-CoA synthetase